MVVRLLGLALLPMLTAVQSIQNLRYESFGNDVLITTTSAAPSQVSNFW